MIKIYLTIYVLVLFLIYLFDAFVGFDKVGVYHDDEWREFQEPPLWLFSFLWPITLTMYILFFLIATPIFLSKHITNPLTKIKNKRLAREEAVREFERKKREVLK